MKNLFKKVFFLEMAVAIIFIMTASVFAAAPQTDLIFQDNFDSYNDELMENENLNDNDMSGWLIKGNATNYKPDDTPPINNSTITLQDDIIRGDTGKAVLLKRTAQTANGNHELYKDFGNPSKTYGRNIIESYFYVKGDIKSRLDVRIENQNGSNQITILLNFANNKVEVDGVSFSKSVTLPYETWFKLKADIDVNRMEFDLYIDEDKINTEKIPFRNLGNSTGYMKNFAVYSQRNSGGFAGDKFFSIYVDDVSMNHISLESLVAADKEALDIDVLNKQNISENFTLDVLGENGSVISWASSNTEYIEILDGNKAVVYHSGVDKEVTLTATISNFTASDTKTFDLKIPAANASDIDISNAFKGLDFSAIKSANTLPRAVTSALSLPTQMGEGVSVTWESDNPHIISTTGTVNRSYTDRDVKLTATLGKSGSTLAMKKEINVRVLKKGALLMTEDFEYDESELTYSHTDNLNLKSIGPNAKWNIVDNNGTDLNNYNPGSSIDNSRVTLQDTVSKSGKAVLLRRTASTETGNHELRNAFGSASTSSGRLIAEGSLYISENDKRANVMLVDDKGKRQVGLYFEYPSRLFTETWNGSDGDVVSNINTSTPLPKDKWFDWKIDLDTDSQTFDVYIDGIKQNADKIYFRFPKDRTGTTVGVTTAWMRDIIIYSERKTYTSESFSIYADDIIIRTYEQEDYTINNLYFKDKSGVKTAQPVPGGTISEIDITKNTTAANSEKTNLFITLYSQDKLTDVKIFDLENANLNSAINLNSIPIPESSDARIEVFLWGKDDMQPYLSKEVWNVTSAE